MTQHEVVPTASNTVYVTEHETFAAKVIATPSGKTVLDFGQNIEGTLGKWYGTSIPTGIGLKYHNSISNYGQSYGEVSCSWEKTEAGEITVKVSVPANCTAEFVFGQNKTMHWGIAEKGAIWI